MRVKEMPLTIGGRTFDNVEEFAAYVRKRQLPRPEVIERVKQRLTQFEQKYGMTSEKFYQTIAGTPAEDEPHYLMWKMDYEAYMELMEKE